MKNLQRGFIVPLLLTIIALLIIGGGIYLYTQKNQPPTIVLNETATTTAQTVTSNSASPIQTVTPSATNTYANSQYGFSFEYPNDNAVSTIGYGSTHPFTSAPIVFLRLSNAEETEGYLTVNVSNDPQDTSNCMETVSAVPEVSINGTTFKKIDFSGGGVNGFGREYKTLHNNYCYDIGLTSFASACVNSGCENPLWSTQTMQGLLNTLDTYAQTFKFIDPSSVVPPTVQVDGMNKYIENTFGYTFWYPSGWIVNQIAVQNPNKYEGGIVTKTLEISDGTRSVYIDQFHSNGLSIEDTNKPSKCCNFVDDVMYFFDPTPHLWMVNFPTGNSVGNPNSRAWTNANPQKTTNPIPVDLSNNTMGGLHIFDGVQAGYSNNIIPLSADNFLVVNTAFSTNNNSYLSLLSGLVDTIGATDTTVATPVGPYDQINAIQQEKSAYTGE